MVEFDLCLSKVMHGRHGEGVYMESFGVNKPCVCVCVCIVSSGLLCSHYVCVCVCCVCVCVCVCVCEFVFVNCAHQSFLCEVHVIV